MANTTVTTSKPARVVSAARKPAKVVSASVEGGELEKIIKEGEKMLDRCDCSAPQEVEYVRHVLRASKSKEGEELLDRCQGGGLGEIEFMRQVLRAQKYMIT